MDGGIRETTSEEEELHHPHVEEEQLIIKEVEAPIPSWSWIIDINRRLVEEHKNTHVNGGNLARIDKYPAHERFSKIQEDAFLPEFVSIGPYFDPLPEAEEQKERLLVHLLGGRKNDDIGLGRRRERIKLEELVKAMKSLEDKTRACYKNSDRFTIRRFGGKDSVVDLAHIDSETFVKMMVLDGCFVIEVLRLHWYWKAGYYVEDPIIRSSTTIQKLQRDFLVLGNQLPLFVLQELYSLITWDPHKEEVQRRAIDFLIEFAGQGASGSSFYGQSDCHHLLHLFSYACTNLDRRVGKKEKRRRENKKLIYRATKLTYNAKELQEAGVKIKPKPPTKEDGLMSIDTLKGTILRIQPLYLDHNVVFMLLNFLAFEQCHPEAHPYFTSYIMFLDCLIDSEADVEVLHKAGILNHAFGNNKDVANIIYKVTKELKDPDYNHFISEMMELNSYCKAYYGSKWRPWWRNLIRNYFNSPWTVTSLVAATILLILTLVQTYYTIYAYYKPVN